MNEYQQEVNATLKAVVELQKEDTNRQMSHLYLLNAILKSLDDGALASVQSVLNSQLATTAHSKINPEALLFAQQLVGSVVHSRAK